MNQTKPEIDSIFCKAVELPSPEARAAFLNQASAGDVETKARVEKLLEAHFQAGSFLESPPAAFAPTITEPRVTESPGDRIGPYKLREVLGEGGMQRRSANESE